MAQIDQIGKDSMIGNTKQWQTVLLTGLAVIGVVPVILFWSIFGRAPWISAEKARQMIEKQEINTVLVDVRSPVAFNRKHIVGAINWPYPEILKMTNADDIPKALRNRTLLLICNVGLESARATLILRSLSADEVYNVRGGLQSWGDGIRQLNGLQNGGFRSSDGTRSPFPYRDTSLPLQWFVSLTAFGIKPLYMAISLALIIILKRRKAGDLEALKWALILFLTGEVFCAINYLLFSENSYLLEYLHSYGMVMAFALAVYAIIMGLEDRILKLNHPNDRCTGLSLCPRCIKYEITTCGAMRLLMLMAIFFSVCALIPLQAPFHAVGYITHILGSDYFYTHPVTYQMFEARFAPVAAILLYLGAAFLLGGRNTTRFFYGRLSFAAATGLLGFAYFRVGLLSIFREDLAWFVIWEELTELLFIAAVAAFLWLFRARLLQPKAE